MRAGIEHKNILKSFLILLFIGVYFFCVTPVHMYAHTFFENSPKTEKNKTENNPIKQNNCNYYKYVSSGLGNVLVGDIQSVEGNNECYEYQSYLYDIYTVFFKNYILNSKILRGPPFIS